MHKTLLFFFQAEDGIRDPLVTGVQTCALPISIIDSIDPLTKAADGKPTREARVVESTAFSGLGNGRDGLQNSLYAIRSVRSEERRVGKECRCRWSTDQ